MGIHIDILDVEATDAPIIKFGSSNRIGLTLPQNDTLVIIATLANYKISRIFIDSRSLADILFGVAYDQMQLREASRGCRYPFSGFAGEMICPRGIVALLLSLRRTLEKDLHDEIYGG
ncbi:hypothetical protein Sango_2706000 [Sesamum angolense]|uniref:Uncharacterized protein n=1 Tax=Sesamum angolense TaxID=2727404 RepID=A0AAE2BHS7_9LAMI|nr:hypothetical protein Sango_2706000 [Sesamum angolense]